ncbi:MAG: hypothetical protein JRI23_23255 [Deltaproteobacteria bacterium]|jgi:hypothetical protein|nr:hypothetical protein [Deltaproteobacteria bacterium]MBW2534891.1 hypothetical protein [Deltaproteobacteria bacterium]
MRRSEGTIRLLFAGAAASGRRTSLEALRGEVGSNEDGSLRGHFWPDVRRVVVRWHAVTGARAPWSEPGTPMPLDSEESTEFFRCLDAVVFVVDPRRSRFAANDEALDRLRRELHRAGRLETEVPVVFQLNKLDLPLDAAGATMFGLFTNRELPAALLVRAPVAVLRQRLRWPRRDYVETIASEGIGVVAVVEAALRLLREHG